MYDNCHTVGRKPFFSEIQKSANGLVFGKDPSKFDAPRPPFWLAQLRVPGAVTSPFHRHFRESNWLRPREGTSASFRDAFGEHGGEAGG